ncbi:MAG: hypothetical protein JNK74_15420 [Candidatus Hydrogenedentes bacterium]|nr:hypothetical protein [Candidatus Hydrogenedentota bacterium]
MAEFRDRILVGILSIVAACGAGAGDGVHLALSGLHNAADPVRGGGDWWGIFPEGEGYTFQPVRVRVEAVVDPLADGDTRKTATLITVPGKVEDIPLIRGLMSSVAGPLKSLKPEKNWGYIAPGNSITLPWVGAPKEILSISAEGREARKHHPRFGSIDGVDYKLRLNRRVEKETTTQVIASLPVLRALEGPELLWAGDLDRDGKLDLLYNLSSFYIDTELALFLSSAAKEGELVGLVARWNAVGWC